jgi:hypothetical protein
MSDEPDELSVLDYFAAAAMAGVCPTNPWTDHTYQQAAANCYRMAEAMMAERAKRDKDGNKLEDNT